MTLQIDIKNQHQRLKALVASKKAAPVQAAPPVSAPAPAAKPVQKEKPKPAVVGHETVTCSCGHTATLELFAEKQDKFRDVRRKKLQDRPCQACRVATHEARQAAEQAAAAARPKKPKKPPVPGSRDSQFRPPATRLPDGSEFSLRYSAATKTWTGTMTVEGETFEQTCSGVFRLMKLLDRAYTMSYWKKAAATSQQPAGPEPAP